MKKQNIKIISIIFGVPVIICALVYLLTAGAYVAKTVAQNPTLPHVTINNITFHAESFGDPNDPVVIVLRGGPGDDYKSLLSLKELSDEYFVVFYDQRGTGLSPRVGAEELTFDLTVSDLDLIVDHFSQGRKVNLAGHSFGAMVASPYIGLKPVLGNALKDLVGDTGRQALMPFRIGYPTMGALASPRHAVKDVLV